jgi:nitroimidazol reductase NimA-like FMN-containing flavoprotein (pyridoxamine 5'-phosphate oxidase superfamily)
MAMRKNSAVSLQVLKMKDVDNWSFVLAHGTFEEITGSDAKKITRFCEWN